MLGSWAHCGPNGVRARSQSPLDAPVTTTAHAQEYEDLAYPADLGVKGSQLGLPARWAGRGQARRRHLDMAADADRSFGAPIASQMPFLAHKTSCPDRPPAQGGSPAPQGHAAGSDRDGRRAYQSAYQSVRSGPTRQVLVRTHATLRIGVRHSRSLADNGSSRTAANGDSSIDSNAMRSVTVRRPPSTSAQPPERPRQVGRAGAAEPIGPGPRLRVAQASGHRAAVRLKPRSPPMVVRAVQVFSPSLTDSPVSLTTIQ
jgi:hypothetical protein